MQELNGGGAAPARIEAGPGSFGGGAGNAAGDVKPWQRGPTGGPAPWRSRNDDRDGDRAPPSGPSGGPAPWARDRGGRGQDHRDGGDSYYGGGHNNNYGAPAPPPAPGASHPWQQASAAPAASIPGAYGGYPGAANSYMPAYGAPPGMAPPPPSGLPPPPPAGLPDNISALIQQYSGGAPPPPPPAVGAPPPPPSDQPPPPPPPPGM